MKLAIHLPEAFQSSRSALERLIRLGLTRFVPRVQRISLSIRDQNGPRGGEDLRCVVQITLNGLPTIVIEETGTTVSQVAALAVERAVRNVARAIERRRRHREYHDRRLARSD